MTDLLMPADAAAYLVTWLETQGAVVELDEHDFVRASLDGIREMDMEKADSLAHAILGLRDEIRALLIARRTRH